MATTSADCSSGRGDFFHFTLSFYTDSEATNLVHTVSSEDEWWNFYANGSQFTSQGAFVCQGETSRSSCVNVEYRPPLDAPDVLFNQVLYVKVSKPTITFDKTIGEGLSDSALIIFVVDESGSMHEEHAWLVGMAESLESSLLENGIGPNSYGLVGFGRNPKHNTPPTHTYKYPLGTPLGEGPIVSNVDDLLTILRLNQNITTRLDPNASIHGLSLDGGVPEDGYFGINTAVSYPVNDEFTTVIVLVSDEDRDIVNDQTTKQYIQNILTAGEIKFSALVAANFKSADGPAIGIRPDDGVAWIAQPGGEFTRSTEGEFISPGNDGSIGVENDYIDLSATSVGGTSWNLNILRDGGDVAESFTKAFIDALTEQITLTISCENLVEPDSMTFFCAREEIEEDEIDITFVNDRSTDLCVHGRITFYADADRKSVVFSHFSLLDQRRWFERNNPPCPFTPNGSKIEGQLYKEIIYVPDVRPPDFLENSPTYNLKGGEQEKSLNCGATYYVDVEAYYGDTKAFELINQFTYTPQCRRIRSRNWRENTDQGNWISSYNGLDDFRVSRTNRPTIHSSVATNIDGQFFISWQDFRDLDYLSVDAENQLNKLDYQRRIMYGVYDADQDAFFSSGQGYYDTEALTNSMRPQSLSDFTGNFYLIGNTGQDLLAWKCAFEAPESATPPSSTRCLIDETTEIIESSQRSNEFFLNARVASQDARGSYVVDANTIVSVVEDYIIKIEASGIPGAYAVRLRNENDADWSDWVSIDSELAGVTRLSDSDSATATGDDAETLSAYYIDSDRFIVPWILSCGSGVKKVSLQVLTFSGVSQIFDMQVLANVEDLLYDIVFAEDEEFTLVLPQYSGFPVANIKPLEDSETTSDSKDIYIKVTFKEKEKLEYYLNTLSKWERMSHLADGITFSVIQQGTNDQTDIPLSQYSVDSVAEPGVYWGKFTVNRSDGIYNKDGSAAIVVNVPRGCNENLVRESTCPSETRDKYNVMDPGALRAFDAVSTTGTIQDLNPETIADGIRAMAGNKVANITSMTAPYNGDDPDNAFGNPDLYSK